MISNIIGVLLFFIGMVAFAFYKREMLVKMFSIDITSSANRFQQQLEQTGDTVIKRLEEQIIHLEYLLEEANEKITSLDQKIQVANKILAKEFSTNKIIIPEIMMEEPQILSSRTMEKKSVNEAVDLSIDNKEMARHQKRNSIIEMVELGYDISEIAKATGISQGEIILLMQLNKK